MKVIHFIASIDKTGGGTTAYMKIVAEGLAKFNINQIIISGRSDNPVEIHGVKLKLFESLGLTPFHRVRVKGLLKSYISILKLEKPDIIHINGLWNYENSLFQKAAKSLNIKVILSPHGMLEPYILNRNSLKKKIALFLYQKQSLQKVDAIHATALSELEQIQSLGYHNPSIVIPNGIDTNVIPQKKWKINKEGKIKNLLFLSRVHPKKGIDLLIKAVSKLDNKYLRITIAGNGEEGYINELKKLTKDLSLTDQFNFVGPLYGNKKWELYGKSDVFILPSYSENFGIVIAEALHIGLPVITTTGTPWKELQTHHCGWWVDLSVSNLVSTLEEVIELDNELLQEMGENGKELIKMKYTVESVTKAMFSFYNSCISK
ncbi:glycosyltransferase [Lutibacter holmesii]|uniref:Glycosyltransferase n=1 Tax=Lutibacter holmesii TaxID=1137985 RepID=A0ABW3WQ93_9FLAO